MTTQLILLAIRHRSYEYGGDGTTPHHTTPHQTTPHNIYCTILHDASPPTHTYTIRYPYSTQAHTHLLTHLLTHSHTHSHTHTDDFPLHLAQSQIAQNCQNTEWIVSGTRTRAGCAALRGKSAAPRGGPGSGGTAPGLPCQEQEGERGEIGTC